MLLFLFFSLLRAESDQKTPNVSAKQKAIIIFGGAAASAILMVIMGWIALKFMKPAPEVEYVEVIDDNIKINVD